MVRTIVGMTLSKPTQTDNFKVIFCLSHEFIAPLDPSKDEMFHPWDNDTVVFSTNVNDLRDNEITIRETGVEYCNYEYGFKGSQYVHNYTWKLVTDQVKQMKKDVLIGLATLSNKNFILNGIDFLEPPVRMIGDNTVDYEVLRGHVAKVRVRPIGMTQSLTSYFKKLCIS